MTPYFFYFRSFLSRIGVNFGKTRTNLSVDFTVDEKNKTKRHSHLHRKQFISTLRLVFNDIPSLDEL